MVLKGFKDDDKGGYGLTPIFDQGILNPEYKDKTEKQLDGTSGINYKEQIGSWDSVIPQETTTSVRYVDLETGKDIAQPLKVTGYGYQGFKINGDAPKIDGYTLVSSPKTLGLSYEDGIIAPYKVGQTYTQYITDDVYVKQTVLDTDGTVRATAYYKGQPIGASASKILGHDDNNDSMSFMAGGQSYTYNNKINDVDVAMVYYYKKDGEEGKSQLRVHYIDVTKNTADSQYAPGDGVPATNPNSGQEMNPLTYTGNIGDAYDYATNAKAPKGYVLVGTSSNLKGTFSRSDHDAYIYVKIDRNGARATIESLTHLNHAQKQAAKDAVDKATNSNENSTAEGDATTLDQGMASLKQAISDGEGTHGTVAYDEADADKKSALDNAIKNGQAVTDVTNGGNDDLSTVRSLTQAIETAKVALNGENNLETAQNHANQDIDQMGNLSGDQKQNAETAIKNAKTSSDVAMAENDAKTLNDDLGKLSQAISDANQAKTTPNYTEADPEKQKALDDALSEAEQAKDSNDPSEVEKATKDLQDAQSALNGDANKAKAENEANDNTDESNQTQVTNQSTNANNSNLRDADKITISVPGTITVHDKSMLTSSEKAEIEQAIRNANPDLPQGTNISVDDTGNADITYPDGSSTIVKTTLEQVLHVKLSHNSHVAKGKQSKANKRLVVKTAPITTSAKSGELPHVVSGKNKLPQTGEKNSEGATIAGLLALGLLLIGLMKFKRREDSVKD